MRIAVYRMSSPPPFRAQNIPVPKSRIGASPSGRPLVASSGAHPTNVIGNFQPRIHGQGLTSPTVDSSLRIVGESQYDANCEYILIVKCGYWTLVLLDLVTCEMMLQVAALLTSRSFRCRPGAFGNGPVSPPIVVRRQTRAATRKVSRAWTGNDRGPIRARSLP